MLKRRFFLAWLFILTAALMAVLQAQTLISASPNYGYVGQLLTTTITGQGTVFLPASPNIQGIYLQQSTTVINSLSFSATTDTTVDATFNVPLASPVGYYDVHVNTATQGNLVLTGGVLILLSGIEEDAEGFFIKVYPNPVSSSLQVKSQKFNDIRVKVLDVKGSVVFSGEYRDILNRQLDIPQVHNYALRTAPCYYYRFPRIRSARTSIS